MQMPHKISKAFAYTAGIATTVNIRQANNKHSKFHICKVTEQHNV